MDEYTTNVETFKKNLPKKRLADYQKFVNKDKKSRAPKQSRNHVAVLEDSVAVEQSDEDVDESSNFDEMNGGNSPKKQKLK